MYLSLDKENMRFVHAHRNQLAVSHLIEIELCHVHTLCFDGTFLPSYSDLTDLEVILLYRNTFGADLPVTTRAAMLGHLLHYAAEAPETDCNPFEVEVQARWLASRGEPESEPWQYVKGSNRPQVVDVDLWDPQPLRGAQGANVPPATLAAPPRADRPAVGTTPAPQPARAPSAPRAPGGAKTVIWDVADAMWAAAGKPTALPTVLALRKTIMAELEAKHGVKKTTSSTSLGGWQADRLKQPLA